MIFLDPHVTRVAHFPNIYGSASRGDPFQLGGSRTPLWVRYAVVIAIALFVCGFAIMGVYQ